jgi:hemerythrin superfamily protein
MTSWNPTPPDRGLSLAIERLIDDHGEIEALFELFSKQGGPVARESLVTRICNELKLHAEVEDEIVFPLLRELQFDARLMEQAQFELARARILISMIESAEQFDDRFVAMVKMLGRHMEQHFRTEEVEMLPHLRQPELAYQQV